MLFEPEIYETEALTYQPSSCLLRTVSSGQLLSRVRLLVTTWISARKASLSITNSRSLVKLMSIESVMPSNHLILCRPLLLTSSIFPSIRVEHHITQQTDLTKSTKLAEVEFKELQTIGLILDQQMTCTLQGYSRPLGYNILFLYLIRWSTPLMLLLIPQGNSKFENIIYHIFIYLKMQS